MIRIGTRSVVRLLMGSAMIFAGVAHLTFKRKEFQAQVPRWLPTNQPLMDITVITSGIVEITLGMLMILWKEKRISTGLMLALFFLAIYLSIRIGSMHLDWIQIPNLLFVCYFNHY
ncbi:MauE/DoxX family redox-associated membrane protein [Zunongwangia sp.]|uniref:DoxX family protein n=1 Tax=Zunongwangia sp. TaxID=1965325 RepID=UPI003AA882FE